MVFRKIKAALGIGVSVDTVLTDKHVVPGGVLRGQVLFNGGSSEYHVQGIGIEFQAVVEVEQGDNEYRSTYNFLHAEVSGPFDMAPNAEHSVPFEPAVPWETPVSSVSGQHLRGMQLGVATELRLQHALDKSDMDPLIVEPLPIHNRILKAVDQLGFVFHKADLEAGTLRGSRMPFYQEIEYWTAGEFRRAFKALELTFITDPTHTTVIVEVDKPGGVFTRGGDSYGSFRVENEDASDLSGIFRSTLQDLTARRGLWN